MIFEYGAKQFEVQLINGIEYTNRVEVGYDFVKYGVELAGYPSGAFFSRIPFHIFFLKKHFVNLFLLEKNQTR